MAADLFGGYDAQDVAREFLTGKNGPSEKYELFMRATMLDKTQ